MVGWCPALKGHLVVDSFDTALLLPSGICKIMKESGKY